MSILLHWLVFTIAIAFTAWLLPGVRVSGPAAALLTALVLGFINTFIRPFLLLLTLPVNILTLGLFTLVINALLIMATSGIISGFRVDGFWWAVIFSLVLSVVHFLLRIVVP
jgi:putative membrane protein